MDLATKAEIVRDGIVRLQILKLARELAELATSPKSKDFGKHVVITQGNFAHIHTLVPGISVVIDLKDVVP